MKLYHIKIIFCLFLILPILISCSDEEELVPDITEEEPTTTEMGSITAKINGEAFESIGTAAVITSTAIFGGQFIIGGGNPANGVTSLGMNLFVPPDMVINQTRYEFGNELCDSEQSICGIMTVIGNTFGGISSLENGNFEVVFTTLDYQPGGACKGTFSGTLVNESNQSVLSVTDGKFNLQIEE